MGDYKHAGFFIVWRLTYPSDIHLYPLISDKNRNDKNRPVKPPTARQLRESQLDSQSINMLAIIEL